MSSRTKRAAKLWAQNKTGSGAQSWMELAQALANTEGNRLIIRSPKEGARFIVARHNGKKFRSHSSPRKQQRSDQFYSTWEWKKARFEALKRYGPVCMCCGSEYRIVVDHIKPRSRFPSLELDSDNLQILCNSCNMGKSNDDYTDFRPKVDELSHADRDELELIAEADRWLH